MNVGEKYYCSRCMREIGQEQICPHCGFDPSIPMPGSQMEEGTLLYHGRYELGTVIGQGGFGITYSAWDLVLDIPVAIKEYFPASYCERNASETDDVSPRPDCGAYYQLGLQTFVREARILAMLQNIRSVVKVYDCFEKNQTAYIVMEFVHGETLWSYCRDHRPDEKRLLKMLRGTIDDMILVHKAGVLHRDISPNNLLVQEDGMVKLIDFGAASNLSGTGNHATLNRHFAAPEQFDSDGKQGVYTDVYGLAATLYALFSGEMIQDAPSRLKEDHLRKPRKQGVRVSGRTSDSIFRALRLDPGKRTQSLEEFRAELYHLPRPIQSMRQKVLFALKIISVLLIAEGAMLLVKYGMDTHLLRQARLSAEALWQGDGELGYHLAVNYWTGVTGEEAFDRDTERAAFWYEWAAEHGSGEAATEYGYLLENGLRYERNIPMAVRYYRMGADAGVPRAFNNLGILYLRGTDVEPDAELALEYLARAADGGEGMAMVNLGQIFRNGICCEIDEEKAVAYYRAAAERDEPLGYLYLGECYAKGIGVEQDFTRFLEYCCRAAVLGCSDAMFRLGECYRTGELGYVDYSEAMDWYEAAMQESHGGGFYGAAILYRDGLGVEEDPIEASKLMHLAAFWGYEPAVEECRKMIAAGDGIVEENADEGALPEDLP